MKVRSRMGRSPFRVGIIGPVSKYRWWDAALWTGLWLWFVGFAWHWWRPSLWLLDLIAIPVAAILYFASFIAVIVGVIGGRRWIALLALVPVLAALTALVNPTWRVAPQAWFALNRPLYEQALDTRPGDDYYGAKLPVPLRFLSADGKVSEWDGNRFFPQWIGIPDDAGGYLYNPRRSPAGADLYGMECRDPIDLGDGWWMCGLAETGL